VADSRSEALFEHALRVAVGGVHSPVRSFAAVGGTPRFIRRGDGARVYDEGGREYVDYVMSWGPLVLGHAHPDVVAAVARAAERGTSFGAPTVAEIELAREVCQAMPSIERVRFTSSGTEACMSALRLARAFTGRERIVKCAGCYHGHADDLLVSAGSGALTLGVPDSPGVPAAHAANTVVVPFGSADALRGAFKRFGDEIACFILEPVAGNMGVVRPPAAYLETARELTKAAGALLVFDEVITGFRLAYGGAQAVAGVSADLTCLGKIVGGGLPVGAFGGRADIMERLAPLGDVYQAGTLSGNPLAMAAGLTQLRALKRPGTYELLEERAASLARGLQSAFDDAGAPAHVARAGSMLTAFFTRGPVTDLETARRANVDAYAAFFHGMLERGVFLPPAQFESAFVSTAHSPIDVERTVSAARDALAHLQVAQPSRA